MTLAEGVSSSQETSIEKTFCTSDSIRSECLRSFLDEFRVLHEGTNLPHECDRLLLKFLRVSNVAISNIVERKTRGNALLLGFLELLLQFMSTNCHSTTNFILGSNNRMIDGIRACNMNVGAHVFAFDH